MEASICCQHRGGGGGAGGKDRGVSPSPADQGSGKHCKLPSKVQGEAWAKKIWCIFSHLIEHFWWNDSVASKRENFWPFFCFLPLI